MLRRHGLAAPWAWPFWTLVSIRVAFWFVAALALLWEPLDAGDKIPPYRAYEARTDLLFAAFAQWDATWFLNIAENGYVNLRGTLYQPLYPLLARALSYPLFSLLVASVLISLVAAGIGAVLVERLATPLLGERTARDAVLLLALFPVAFVFTAPFSEGLFLALSAGAFLAAVRERPWLAGGLAALAVSTRLAGLALIPPLLYLLWPRTRDLRAYVRPLGVALVPIGLLAYMAYLHRRFDDPFAFARAPATYWERETATLGPLGGLWSGLSGGWHGAAELGLHLPRASGHPAGLPDRDQLAALNVVHALVLVAALWLTWVAWRRLGPAYGLYALTSTLLPLAAVVEFFPLVSFPRYALVNFPLFLALAAVLADRPAARQVVLVAFGALGGAAAVAFAHGVWIA